MNCLVMAYLWVVILGISQARPIHPLSLNRTGRSVSEQTKRLKQLDRSYQPDFGMQDISVETDREFIQMIHDAQTDTKKYNAKHQSPVPVEFAGHQERPPHHVVNVSDKFIYPWSCALSSTCFIFKFVINCVF